MGGEMVYILQQRLQAQAVQDDKARKVLQDVVRAMYSPLFITELFKPQEMYSTTSTRQIFEKLAHSSIMRLNKSSMEKLFDLMTMGFKYQVVSCHSPQQLIHVTLSHLESLKKLVKSDRVEELIQVAIDRTVDTYSTLSNGQWMLLKQSIMRFLQGKKIKVSLFLQQGLQSMDGTLILDMAGKLPLGTEPPGTIRRYDGKTISETLHFETIVSEGCIESESVLDTESQLGANMYSKEAAAEAKSLYPESSFAAAKAIAAATGVLSLTKGKRQAVTAKSAKAELTLLSDLLGMGSSAKDEEAKPFKLNLFPDYSFDKAEGKDGGEGSTSYNNIIMIDIDAGADAKTFARYMDDLALDDSDAKRDSKMSAEDDDLLALMDSTK